jgi:hypothetical protein
MRQRPDRAAPEGCGPYVREVRCQPQQSWGTRRKVITERLVIRMFCRLATRQDALGAEQTVCQAGALTRRRATPALELPTGPGARRSLGADNISCMLFQGDGVSGPQLMAGSLPSPRTLRTGVTAHTGKVNRLATCSMTR